MPGFDSLSTELHRRTSDVNCRLHIHCLFSKLSLNGDPSSNKSLSLLWPWASKSVLWVPRTSYKPCNSHWDWILLGSTSVPVSIPLRDPSVVPWEPLGLMRAHYVGFGNNNSSRLWVRRPCWLAVHLRQEGRSLSELS